VLTFLETQTIRKGEKIYEASALSFPYVKSQLTVLSQLYADRTAIWELAIRWKNAAPALPFLCR